MVCNWSPEPPRDVDNCTPIPSQVMVAESDDSEDELPETAPLGYELLPQGPSLGISSDEEEQSDTETTVPDDPANSTSPTDDASTSENSRACQHSEVQEVDRLFSTEALRPQMVVDCDEVRAAMAGFMLPPSAYPVWATDIPESQWTVTLAQQIQRIQTGNSGC